MTMNRGAQPMPAPRFRGEIIHPAMPPMPPPVFTGWDVSFVKIDDKDKTEVLTEHAKKTVALFRELKQLLWDAVAGGQETPAVRLLDHAERPVQRWEMYRQLLPQEYDEAQKDFHLLLERAHAEPDFAQQVEEEHIKREQARQQQSVIGASPQ